MRPVIKKLFRSTTRLSGKNNRGKVTQRHRGGGPKTLFRILSYNPLQSTPYRYLSVFKDPRRNSLLAALVSTHKSISLVLASRNALINKFVAAGPFSSLKPGVFLPLKFMPLGSRLYNLTYSKNVYKGIARSAGTSVQLMSKSFSRAIVRLPSSQIKIFTVNSIGQLGVVSSKNQIKLKFTKAGQKRWINRRPRTRGEAMNPVDHPHGGKTRGGRHPVSFNNVLSSGYKTARKPKSFISKSKILFM